MILDIGIPVGLVTAAGSTLGMLRGPQSWPGPGWGQGQGQGPLLFCQAEQDFSLRHPCTSVSDVSQGIHMWMDQHMDIPQG